MLDVQLQLVVFVEAEFVCPLFEPCERWHSAARRVQIISPDLACGGICNLQFRQYGTVLPYELTQGLHAVAHTLEIATGNRNAVSVDSQRVCAGGTAILRIEIPRIRNTQSDEARPHIARRNIPISACRGTYVGNKLMRKQEIAIANRNGFVHAPRIGNSTVPSPTVMLFGSGMIAHLRVFSLAIDSPFDCRLSISILDCDSRIAGIAGIAGSGFPELLRLFQSA